MNISRIIGASCDGLETHHSKYYKRGFTKVMSTIGDVDIPDLKICDPFARDCRWGTHTNDLNPDTLADEHMDALEWLKAFPDDYFNVVLFDPPFSASQAERYGKGMSNIYTQGEYLSDVYFECARILKHGGQFLKLGYNSNRPSPTLDLKEMWVTCFGGNRNDVIMTLWRKNQQKLPLEP